MSLPERVKNLPRTNDALLTESREYEGALNRLRRSEAYLAEAQRLTRTGSWAWVPSSEGELEGWHYWSEEMFRIFEFDPREGPPTSEMWCQRIHPEDRQPISESIQKALENKGEYVNDYRIQCPDGRLKYIHSIGHPIFNDAGEISEFVGTSVDVTEQKRIEEASRRSDAYLAEGQRLTHTGSWTLNIATRQILHSSAEHTRMFGLDPERGLPSFEEFLRRVHPEDQEHVLETFQTLMRSGGDLDLRYRIAAPDCPVRYMHAIGHPVPKESGTPGEYVGITIDTTERRRLDQERAQAENRLRRSEAYLAEAQQLSHTGSFGWDVSSGEIYWSPETFRIFGFALTEKVTVDLILERIHPEDRKAVQQLLERVTQQRTAFDFEHRLLMPDGSVKYVHTVGRPSENESDLLEFVGAVTDVSERKLAEHVLRRSDGYLTETQRLNRIGSWAFTLPSRKPHYWSDELFRIWGFDPQEGAPDDQAMLQRVHPDDRDNVRQFLELLLEGSITSDAEGGHRIVLPDGTVKYLHGVVHPVFDEAGHVVEYVGSVLDVTERKRAEQVLRRSEAYLGEAERLSHTGSWALDPVSGKMIYYSEGMFRIMGLEPTLDPPDWDTILRRVHPEDIPPIIEGIELTVAASKKHWTIMDQTTGSLGLQDPRFAVVGNELRDPTRGAADAFEYRIVLPDGSLKYVRSYGHPIVDKTGKFGEFFGTAIDVTELKKAEFERERLRQLEADLAHMNRISMLGELAASLSHELKQPIAAAVMSARTSLRYLAQDPPNMEEACQMATNAVKAGQRAGEIIDRLRSLYTKAPSRCEMLDGNTTIREMIEMLRAEANRHKVLMNADLAADLPLIMSDRVQLQQVLMNLIVNAIEAMKETGGSVSIESRLNQEGFLQISVSDTGPGLPTEKLEKIFEPFFTTKPKGSGMGLAISRSIIESQGGRLWASANRGCGATFHFTLPTANDVENGRAVVA
jgi:PAS domain S-box-containing protein